MPPFSLILHFAFAANVLGALWGAWSLTARNARSRNAVSGLALVTLILQLTAFLQRWSEMGYLPLKTPLDITVALACLLIAGGLILAQKKANPTWIAASLVLSAGALLAVLAGTVHGTHPGPGKEAWLTVHAVFVAAGAGALGIHCTAAGLYLRQDRRLRQAGLRNGPEGPSLEALDQTGATALSLGFLLLVLGFAVGIFVTWWKDRNLATALGPRGLLSVAALVLYGALFSSRIFFRIRGRKSAILGLAAFATLVIAVFGTHAFHD